MSRPEPELLDGGELVALQAGGVLGVTAAAAPSVRLRRAGPRSRSSQPASTKPASGSQHHQVPAAVGVAPHPASSSRLGMLDVVSTTPARPSGRKHHWARRLANLATKPGEICGLARVPSPRCAQLPAILRPCRLTTRPAQGNHRRSGCLGHDARPFAFEGYWGFVGTAFQPHWPPR